MTLVVPQPVYVGADGCKKGRWIAFLADEHLNCYSVLFDDIKALFQACSAARQILIDVPIGLNDTRRECDTDARAFLSPFGSSVFSSPIRSVLEAENRLEADKISRSIVGRGVTAQTWGIVPRIRDTDQFLRATPAARAIIRECHPEVCFRALAGSPILESKKTIEGAEARLIVLERYVPEARRLVQEACAGRPKTVLSKDDAIDALVALVTAAAPVAELHTLPPQPPCDAHGLTMEMVYRKP